MKAKHIISISICSFLCACSGTPDPEDFETDTTIYGPEVNQPLNMGMVYKFDLEPKQEVKINCNLDASNENAIIVYWTNATGTNLPVALSCSKSEQQPTAFEHKNNTNRIIHFFVTGWNKECTEAEKEKHKGNESNAGEEKVNYKCKWNHSKPHSVSREPEKGTTEHTIIEFYETSSSATKSNVELIIKK